MPAKIVVKDINKTFPSDKGPLSVLERISFSVGDGETVAIVGPSGCGKSTLLSIIAGFERQDRGQVTVDGIEKIAPNAQGILISQHGSVFPWLTVQQNLMFGLNGHAHSDRQ
ncbi:MAG: ATP-binding cassette domain-containing protein, partial [Steroidobacterales bacterium]